MVLFYKFYEFSKFVQKCLIYVFILQILEYFKICSKNVKFMFLIYKFIEIIKICSKNV